MHDEDLQVKESVDGPTSPIMGIKNHNVFTQVYEMFYTDQLDQFPIQSNHGNQYLMVIVEIDSHYIDVEPIKNRSMG